MPNVFHDITAVKNLLVSKCYFVSFSGWLEGERLRDGESGWFPASYCDEVEDEHVRSRNMKNLYKMYAHC